MTTQRFDPATDTREWWRNQIQLHPPQSPEVGRAMDNVRCWFRSLGEMMIDTLPPGPDTTVALRALKEASSLAIGAIACNQWYWEDGGVIEVDRPVSDADARQVKAGFVSPATNAPTWPDGTPIEVGQAVEVVDGDGWSGAVVSVRWRPGGGSSDALVLVERTGGEFDQHWCTPGALIRRGHGKASGT